MTGWTTHDPALFRGGPQVENFRRMSTIYPVRVVRRAPAASPLPDGDRPAAERHAADGLRL
jgi:hypothetical protein